jgi:hypothetical protein
MQWNNVGINELHSKVENAGAGTIIGFNEPELPDQSNMSGINPGYNPCNETCFVMFKAM